MESGLQLRFMADQDTIAALALELSTGFPKARVVSTGEAKDLTELDFDLEPVQELLAMVRDALTAASLIPALLRVFREKRTQRISIEGPFGSVTFKPREKMTQEELRQVMRKLVEL